MTEQDSRSISKLSLLIPVPLRETALESVTMQENHREACERRENQATTNESAVHPYTF